MEEDTFSPEDTFNILVATDIHLGYAEKDGIRGIKHAGLSLFCTNFLFKQKFYNRITTYAKIVFH